MLSRRLLIGVVYRLKICPANSNACPCAYIHIHIYRSVWIIQACLRPPNERDISCGVTISNTNRRNPDQSVTSRQTNNLICDFFMLMTLSRCSMMIILFEGQFVRFDKILKLQTLFCNSLIQESLEI